MLFSGKDTYNKVYATKNGVFLAFLRTECVVIFKAAIKIFCAVVATMTFVRSDKITSFKIWRTRTLTKLKLFINKNFRKMAEYLDWSDYLSDVQNKFGRRRYGV